jgi:DNA mismatch endonuclease (patch repair protein)
MRTDPETSLRMGRVRQSNTKPELIVRRALHRAGIRFRVNNRDLPGSPDLANRRHKWVIFVHGCFWHQHEGCPKATVPKRNHEFWAAKFAANRQRDLRVQKDLRERGYSVSVIWQCELHSESWLQRLSAVLGL